MIYVNYGMFVYNNIQIISFLLFILIGKCAHCMSTSFWTLAFCTLYIYINPIEIILNSVFSDFLIFLNCFSHVIVDQSTLKNIELINMIDLKM
jgi:hypothetical protein